MSAHGRSPTPPRSGRSARDPPQALRFDDAVNRAQTAGPLACRELRYLARRQEAKVLRTAGTIAFADGLMTSACPEDGVRIENTHPLTWGTRDVIRQI